MLAESLPADLFYGVNTDPAEPQGFIKGRVRKDRGRKDIICCPRACSESLGELGLGAGCSGSLLDVLQGMGLCLAL